MLERSIPSLLEMFPRGMTDDQLIWRLRQGGLRPDPAMVLAALTQLSARGEIRRERDRWIAVAKARAPQSEAAVGAAGGTERQASGSLRGIFATFRNSLDEFPQAPQDDTADADVPWRAALSYYAATQRRDPRGTIACFPDQHGGLWQLFHGSGRWWERAVVGIQAGSLPGEMREALSRLGQEGTASIGWPISVFHGRDGATCLPALLIPVVWRLTADKLSLNTEPVSPSLNPAWVREVRRHTAWTEDSLREALWQGEDIPSFGDLADRLAHALARLGGANLRPAELDTELRIDGDGLRNAAGFFLPGEGSFTRAVAADLDQIADWTPEQRQQTALGHLLERTGMAVPDQSVAEPASLTDAQFAAADAALAGPLTLVQGPPGTGKSQTIVALLRAALAQGQSVLFVARNHRAIDEVEARLAQLLPDLPVLTRGRDADGERDQGFSDALATLVESQPIDPDQRLSAQAAAEALLPALAEATVARRQAIERDLLGLRLAELTDRAEALRARHLGLVPRWSLWSSLWEAMARLMRRASLPDTELPDQATLHQVEARIEALRRRFNALPHSALSDPVPLEVPLRDMARSCTSPDPGAIAHLRNRKSEMEFQPGGLKLRALARDDAQQILCHRPIWAITSLSVPARVPLFPGLFDIAIFDEASQCDIASAMPVLARAKRAVVVGDPQQLSFIPGLGRAQEHALMDAAGMPKAGRARWAQSVNSLYDFLAHRLPQDRQHLLSDQFRSAPEIVSYTNAAFYGNRLIARRDDDEFRPPAGFRAGLHWQDVTGPATRLEGGNVNRAEAEWIAQKLVAFSRDTEFDGSVGVISSFNAQVGLIRRLVAEALDTVAQERLRLHVDTVDRWQGGEADVILFSLVAGRGAAQSAITFLSRERRRFNVAISRARAVALVVGDLDWARSCGIAHISMLADRATRPAPAALEASESIWERRMAVALERRGLAFQQQYPVGRRRLDFALFRDEVKLDLEVDGRRWHVGPDGNRKTADRLRDREMIARGWKVRRFWVHELQANMENCLDLVEQDLG